LVLAYFLVDFGRPQAWVPPLGALKPGMLALGGGLIALLARRRELYLPIRAKLIFAFLILMVIGTPFATNRFFAFNCTKDFALFLFGAVLPLMSFVNSYSRVQRLVGFIILIHVPLALYGLTHSGFGIGAFLGDENDFCLALNIVVPYVFFSFYFVRTALRKVVLLLILVLLLFSITSTKSRGGFLGIVAAAGYCWVASPRKIGSLLVLVAVAGPVVALVPDSYWAEIKTIETSTENDDTGAQRLYLWNMGWEMFKDYPIIGVGPTNFQWASPAYESENQQAAGLHVWGKGAHSLYFTLLPEAGVAGVVIFVSIVVVGFRDNWRVRRAYKILLKAGSLPPERLQSLYVLNILTRANDAAMIAFLVSGAFLSVLYYPHFWLQIGIGVAIKRSADLLLARPLGTSPPAPLPTPVRWTPRGARA
jgi:O-antigen ligase